MIAWEVGLMNKWQKRFSEKVDVIRIASWDRFEQIAIEDIMPVFDEYSEFTRTRLSTATLVTQYQVPLAWLTN